MENKMIECPFCAEEIEKGLEICPICDESLVKLAKQKKTEKKKSKKKKILSIILGIILLLVWSVYQIDFEDSEEDTSIKIESNERGLNIITETSIAGIEIIGNTLQKVKNEISPDLTWEDGFIYNGKILLIELYDRIGIIYAAIIYDSSLVTEDGIKVGSVSGDISKKYPNVTVSISELGEFTEINGITYFFDSNWEKTVGDYENDDVSRIIDKTIPVSSICIGDWGTIPIDFFEDEEE